MFPNPIMTIKPSTKLAFNEQLDELLMENSRLVDPELERLRSLVGGMKAEVGS